MHAPKVEQPEPLPEIARPSLAEAPRPHLRNWLPAIAFAIILVALFLRPLIDWVRFAISKERNTYLLLVPFITASLIRTRRGETPALFQHTREQIFIPAIIGAVSLVCL